MMGAERSNPALIMIQIDRTRTPQDLLKKIDRLFDLSADKIRSLERSWTPSSGAPVFTVEGRYTARGWTEWTEGFQYGSALLQFDATDAREFLDLGRERTLTRMAPHLTHMGVHDHGFNNVSTYGALWRMTREGRIDAAPWEDRFYELALKVSGAVQARRWTSIPDGGYIYSFNGAHSLFVDTIRSLRALALAHVLGHRLVEEQDAQVNLLSRLLRARAGDRHLQRLLRTPAGAVRRSRPRGAREPVQRRQRHVSRSEHPAGLLPVQHLDPRARVGDARFRRGDRVSRDAPGRRAFATRATPDADDWMIEAARATVRFLHRSRRVRRRRALLGHRRSRACRARRVGQRPRRSLQRSRAGRQLGRRHCGAGTAAARPPADSPGRGWVAVLAGRLARGRHALRRCGAVPEPGSESSRAAAAFRLSLAERLGSRPAGRAGSARRVQPVGRLPRPRSSRCT